MSKSRYRVLLDARSDEMSWRPGVDAELCDALDEADVELVKVRPVYDAAMAEHKATKAAMKKRSRRTNAALSNARVDLWEACERAQEVEHE